MRSDTSTAIIGAGPYGLSVAAHLRAVGIDARVFGSPMEFWRGMPRQMFLKSPWSASSLSDPGRRFSLDHYVGAHAIKRTEPIPLPMFLDYADWFREKAVGEVDEVMVRCLRHENGGFRLELNDGAAVTAKRVVLAVGINRFACVPQYARNLIPRFASHTQDHDDLTRFKGATVAVVGTGQSGLETAVLLAEGGADVELLVRGPVRWVHRKYDDRPILKHLLYPPSDVGPVGLNWLVSFPSVFRRLPDPPRWQLTLRAIRPSGAKWLRPRFGDRVHATPYTEIVTAEEAGDRLRLTLSDGSLREVDHLFLGTGFAPDLRRLPFIDSELRSHIRTATGHPVLDPALESSVPNLHFAGALAGYTLGPLCRFVAGAEASARQIAKRAARR